MTRQPAVMTATPATVVDLTTFASVSRITACRCLPAMRATSRTTRRRRAPLPMRTAPHLRGSVVSDSVRLAAAGVNTRLQNRLQNLVARSRASSWTVRTRKITLRRAGRSFRAPGGPQRSHSRGRPGPTPPRECDERGGSGRPEARRGHTRDVQPGQRHTRGERGLLRRGATGSVRPPARRGHTRVDDGGRWGPAAGLGRPGSGGRAQAAGLRRRPPRAAGRPAGAGRSTSPSRRPTPCRSAGRWRPHGRWPGAPRRRSRRPRC